MPQMQMDWGELVDEEGFVKSFGWGEHEGIAEFFADYGFVVVRDVLSLSEVVRSVEEVWDQVESTSRQYQDKPSWSWWERCLQSVGLRRSVDRGNPSTWEGPYWPFSHRGIAPDIAVGRQLFQNRQSPIVYGAFCDAIGEDRLLVSLDRVGVIAPQSPQQKEPPAWLHWDINPWFATGASVPFYVRQETLLERRKLLLERWERENSSHKILLTENNATCSLLPPPVQGLIALADARASGGGFMCIPRFHKLIDKWARQTPQTSDFSHVKVPFGDEQFSQERALKVSMRQGSLLIWSSALPHCNYAGESLRMCQYLKMIPASIYDTPSNASPELSLVCSRIRAARTSQVRGIFPVDFKPSVLGAHLFGTLIDQSSQSMPRTCAADC
jgi:hypothetical protein